MLSGNRCRCFRGLKLLNNNEVREEHEAKANCETSSCPLRPSWLFLESLSAFLEGRESNSINPVSASAFALSLFSKAPRNFLGIGSDLDVEAKAPLPDRKPLCDIVRLQHRNVLPPY